MGDLLIDDLETQLERSEGSRDCNENGNALSPRLEYCVAGLPDLLFAEL
jgi:hypothetical protein